MSFLCVSVAEATTQAVLERIRNTVALSPLVRRIEVRLDAMERPDPETLVRACPDGVEMLHTCREGGVLSANRTQRLKLLLRAAAAGVDLLDLDACEVTPFRRLLDVETAGAVSAPRLVISHHDYETTPDDVALQAIFKRLSELACSPGDLIKVATTAVEATDGLRLLSQARAFTRRGGPTAVAMAMGQRGVASRILAPVYGLEHTYASADRSRPTAPGQLAVKDLVETYRFGELAPDWLIYGLLGGAIEDSPSPAMHNACFHNLDLKAVYVPLECSNGAQALEEFAQQGVAGLSVTTPHKSSALEMATHSEEAARHIGAANTLRLNDSGGWHSSNTDAQAAANSLEDFTGALSGRCVGLIGAGGAARAIGYELVRRGVTVVVHGRRVEAARKVASSVGAQVGCPPAELVAGGYDALVNCTPPVGGKAAGESPVSPAAFAPGVTAFDMVYWPAQTKFLLDAEARGARILGGLDMLARQAVGQVFTWTGARVPLRMLREVADSTLRNREQEDRS